MFMLPHLLADGLITLSRALGVGFHCDEEYLLAHPSWLQTTCHEDFRGLILRLPSYRSGYSPAWMEYKMQQLCIFWLSDAGFSTRWIDCE